MYMVQIICQILIYYGEESILILNWVILKIMRHNSYITHYSVVHNITQQNSLKIGRRKFHTFPTRTASSLILQGTLVTPNFFVSLNRVQSYVELI